jgi:hypothetical protein
MARARERHRQEGVGSRAERRAVFPHEAHHCRLVATEVHGGSDEYGVEQARIGRRPRSAGVRHHDVVSLTGETVRHEAHDLVRLSFSRGVDQQDLHGPCS